MSEHAYQRWKRGDPVIMHGARVYASGQVAVVLPLDERRARPLGHWTRFEDTGLLCGLVVSRRGHERKLDGVTLEELVRATVAATD